MQNKMKEKKNLKYTNQIITNRQTYETWCILMPTHFTQFNHHTRFDGKQPSGVSETEKEREKDRENERKKDASYV